MEFQRVIDKRKSVREYEPKRVQKKILAELVKNAVKAPSSSNSQPWKFYIVHSKSKREKIAQIMRKAYSTFRKDFEAKPKSIAETARRFYANMGDCQNIVFIYFEKNQQQKEINIINVSLAAENLMLSAVEKGLGTCWVGSLRYFNKKIGQIVGAKKGEELVASILIGLPKKGHKPLKREKKIIKDVLTFV